MEKTAKIHNVEQEQETLVKETEFFDFFANTMAQLVEKYGKFVLKELDQVA